jgi:triosephosphate isomerase
MNTKVTAQKIIIANWKMNGSISFIQDFIENFSHQLKANLNFKSQFIFCVPTVYLKFFYEQIQQLDPTLRNYIHVGAQNLASADAGAFTGEISGAMLKEVGAEFVLIGHSERRNLFFENNTQIASKVARAYNVGLVPILCVGETSTERETGQTERVIQQQLEAVMRVLRTQEVGGKAVAQPLWVAYEPVWAIGSGLMPTVEEIASVHHFIQSYVENGVSSCKQPVSVLYGGSVKSENAAILWAEPHIDGVLVGGASLKVDELLNIYKAATVSHES